MLKERKTEKVILIILFILIISIIVFSLIKNKAPYADELIHYNTIKSIVKTGKIPEYIVMLPGYHLLMASLAKIFSSLSISSIRFFSLIINLFSIIIFYSISKKIHPDSARIKTLQYFFFPILFPFFFLIYTDMLSILLVLLSFLFITNRKYGIAGLILIASIIVRQNNIIWLFLFAIFIYLKEYSKKFSLDILKEYSVKIWSFILGFLAFSIFVYLNKSLVFIGEEVHPSFTFHLGNIFFILFLFFFLFLPINISNIPKIIKLFQNNRIFFILLLLTAFTIFILFFKNTHPYNQESYSWFLRNKILLFFNSNIYLKIIFFIPIAYSILSLITIKLYKKAYYLIYPATLLYLLPSWLIEQRYYLIPFILFILFRKKEHRVIEHSLLMIYIALSLLIFLGILDNKFFL